ncbi:MAG: hypothetical protein AAGH76_09330 [Pseudomonadota bacterium]
MRWMILVLVTVISGAACSSTPAPAARESTGSVAIATADARRYVVDAQSSDIELRIYRGGRLASLGHNHVISIGELAGELFVASKRSETAGILSFPVAAMRIDEPARRDAAGPDFASVPSTKDITGTRRNMLSERLLDGDRFPIIELAIASSHVHGDHSTVTLFVSVKEQTTSIDVPASITVTDDRVIANGATTLSQRELGLTPFSVMLGALEVKDAIDVQFTVVAIRQ